MPIEHAGNESLDKAFQEQAKDIAAEQAKKPIDERMNIPESEDNFAADSRKTEREDECLRWEKIAEVQLEAAQTMERVVEEFGNHVANFEGAMRKGRQFT